MALKSETPLNRPTTGTSGDEFINMLVNSMTSPSAAFSRNVRHQRLDNALAELPDQQNEALRLRYVENLSTKEIAERLGKSAAAVRVMLTRSVQRLREMLGGEA